MTIQVGNAVTDNHYDNLGTVNYWWSHAMISDKTYRQLMSTCDFLRQKESNECESLYYYAMDQEFGNIDQYNIYAPPCNHSDGTVTGATRHTMRLPHRPHSVFYPIFFLKIITNKLIIQKINILKFKILFSVFVFFFCVQLNDFFSKKKLWNSGSFLRFLESYRGMILVRRNMLKFTIIGQTCRKLFMQTQLVGFHTNGLLAGKF